MTENAIEIEIDTSSPYREPIEVLHVPAGADEDGTRVRRVVCAVAGQRAVRCNVLRGWLRFDGPHVESQFVGGPWSVAMLRGLPFCEEGEQAVRWDWSDAVCYVPRTRGFAHNDAHGTARARQVTPEMFRRFVEETE